MKYIIYFLKGMFVGGTMLIPGVSGGTMAMALGMYQKLISSVANIRKKFKEGFFLLLPFAIGGVAGAVLLSGPLEKLTEMFPLPVMYFFIGAIAGSIPMIFSKAFSLSDNKKISVKDIVCIAAGAVVPIAINYIPKLLGNGSLGAAANGKWELAITFLIGCICAVSLSLPGISTSYMLLILGVYENVLTAFSTLDILYMLPMAVGALIGLLLFSKFLEKLLVKHPRTSYTVILGFIVGSVALVFPTSLPTGAEWAICPGLFALSFALMFMLSKFEK